MIQKIEKDPLDEIFVDKIELNLPTAKIEIKKRDAKIKDLNKNILAMNEIFEKREGLLKSTEDERVRLLKENNELSKYFRVLERLDNLEIEVNKLKATTSD